MTNKVRMIAHLDMDAFFAAVEQLDCPEYRGKPVIVGGLGPRGVVSTASYEARTYGVGSAMPMAKARRLCPNGIYLPPRFQRYQDISTQVRTVLHAYTSIVEGISLDEFFFDLTGSDNAFGSAEDIVVEVKRRVHETTGLTCSVGLAPNRFLAKLGSELCKPDGLMVIRDEQIQRILDPLPVRTIWGVGKVTEQRLRGLGFTTIRELREAPCDLLARKLGSVGRTLHQLARGKDDTPVRPSRETKSISREVTFPQDIHDEMEIEHTLCRLAKEVAAELRGKNLLGKAVRIKIRFPDFQTITRQVRLDIGTDSPSFIESCALDLFRCRVDLENRGVRLLGVGVGQLRKVHVRQLPLFDERETGLKRTVD